MKKRIMIYSMLCIVGVINVNAQINQTFIDEIYKREKNINFDMLGYLPKELIVGAENDSIYFKKLAYKVRMCSSSAHLQKQTAYYCLYINTLVANTKRLELSSLNSKMKIGATKSYKSIIDLERYYPQVKLTHEELENLFIKFDATCLNYSDVVFTSLLCIYSIDFLRFMEKNKKGFKPGIQVDYQKWLSNPNPIFVNEMMMAPPIDYKELLKSVTRNYVSIKSGVKSNEDKNLIQGLIDKLK